MKNQMQKTNGQGDSALQSFLQSVTTSPAPCIHGHNFCSDRDGGQCSDELLSRLNRDNDGEPLGYRDGQTIPLSLGWSLYLCHNDCNGNPYLQGFVNSPCRKGSASLSAARDLGETTDEWAIEIPAKVMRELANPEFDQFD